MTYQFPPDLDELIQKQMATGEYHNEDELLRDALRSLETQRTEWHAIKEGLRTLDAGNQGVSLDEAFRQIRERNGIT